jgi:preprotein translocase subunit SecA
LRGYGQKDPKQEYKKEGYTMFEMLMALIRDEVLEKVFKAQMKNAEGEDQLSALRRDQLSRSKIQGDDQVASHPSAGQTSKPGMMPQAGAPRLGPAAGMGNGQMPGGGAPAKMNRAQRRKSQAKDRKKPKARPSVGS